MSVLTLTTDFGQTDWFAGVLKGVILGIAPRATIVDLTHEIPAGDIRGGAFALAAGYRFFPKGTVHIAVVDPGVGSSRKAIAVRTQNYFFVGPDNGLLSRALAMERVLAIHALENPAWLLQPVSRSFQGRDIFAPAAARLSRGQPIEKAGPPLRTFQSLDWPQPRQLPGEIRGEILYLDRFGNALTNITPEALSTLGKGPLHVISTRRPLCVVATHYQAVAPGKPVAIPGSSGLLEIAVNGGSAREKLRLRVGSRISVRCAKAAK